MDILKMVDERHSVRAYKQQKIAPDTRVKIQRKLDAVNAASGLRIQLLEDAQGAFGLLMTTFAGWKQKPGACLALVGKDDGDLDEKCGYYGEHMVLYLQSLGLNTCWVGMFKRNAVASVVAPGERAAAIIAVGYGENAGTPHRSKPMEKVTDVRDMPDWFRSGVECALKAPTAMNQQRFFIRLANDVPTVEAAGSAPFVKMDLGIVKYHFEVGSGQKL